MNYFRGQKGAEWRSDVIDAIYAALGVAVALGVFAVVVIPLVLLSHSIDRKANPARYDAWCKVHGTNVTFKEWETLYDAKLLAPARR